MRTSHLVLALLSTVAQASRLRASQQDCPLCVAENKCHDACAKVKGQDSGSGYCRKACSGAHPGDEFGTAWFAKADAREKDNDERKARLKAIGKSLGVRSLVDTTPAETQEMSELSAASDQVKSLVQQLQSVSKTSYLAMQEAEQTRVEKENLQGKVAADAKEIAAAEADASNRAQLAVQVVALKSQLAAEKSKTAKEHMRGQAWQEKTQSLENDIRILSRSWKTAAQHEAFLAKAAAAQEAAVKAITAKAAAKAKKIKVAIKATEEDDDSDSDEDDDAADDANDIADESNDDADEEADDDVSFQ